MDPPKPWGEGPENESLADEVLDEFYRRDLISSTERAYYAGACTRARGQGRPPAATTRLSRAAHIVALFTTADDQAGEAMRIAVTSQSTRKRITPKLCNELATALIVRSVAERRRQDRPGAPLHAARLRQGGPPRDVGEHRPGRRRPSRKEALKEVPGPSATKP